jgi:hypothetical protein
MSDTPACPVCDAPELVPERHALTLHDGTVVPDCEHYLCQRCGADPVFSEQIRRNEVKIRAARANKGDGQ